MAKGIVVIDKERCKGCGLCIDACPFGVLGFSQEYNSSGYQVAYMAHPDRCTGCAICAQVCPEVAIEVYREQPAKEGA
ncbi:MAG TPA: 4Fe-4S dicluster domain-containing protein [Candidatus Acetothermia bacterium]|nr:4Fe-4S binding protein [Candidatus Bipolaricaulota bacterium]HDI11118.1 4Fe-4S dicluster domain-containing protein [Candidatus Acetothermia bacterium]